MYANSLSLYQSHVEDLKLLYATTVRKEKDCRRWPPHFINRSEFSIVLTGHYFSCGKPVASVLLIGEVFTQASSIFIVMFHALFYLAVLG